MRCISMLITLLASGSLFALEPAEILIVSNRNHPDSRRVAEHYQRLRKVPVEQHVELNVPREEELSRQNYDQRIAEPLRRKLEELPKRIRCLLLVYGMPLRIRAQEPSAEAKADWESVKQKLQKLQVKLDELQKQPKPDPVERLALQSEIRTLSLQEAKLSQAENHACVDSELMCLLWPSYSITRWQPNPMHWQFPSQKVKPTTRTLMTARLDGPTAEIAMRLVSDAVEVEKKGLEGKVYVDARGIAFNRETPSENGGYGYGAYDQSMREMAKLFEGTRLKVVLDDRSELFPRNSCEEAALYCGWYSLANYQECCRFVPGAIAWHLASAEAVSLKKGSYWCPNLLKAGVAATLGPVAEPYTIGFPKPEEFFGFLACGDYTLVECYARTIHFTSWMTVLVGDPLYCPFREKPLITAKEVKPSPSTGTFLFR